MEDNNPDKTSRDLPGKEPEDSAEEEDFAALFEAAGTQKDDRVQRDSKINGTIVSVSDEWIFVDIGGKSEAIIAREELLDKDGQFNLTIGDSVTAYVVSTREGEIRLSVKMTAAASEEAVRDAYRSGVPVEGLVNAERKGGYSVTVLGKQAFCPYSQIDLPSAGSPEAYVGKRFTFRIMEYSERGRNIVLSRRDILEEERAKTVALLKQSLKPGDQVTGTVQNIAAFGAFVDIGGVQGLIPISEIAWHRVGNVSDILNPGDTVTVKIVDLDWDKKRISLSRKQVLEDPWDTVSQRYADEGVVSGRVVKLMNFGAFVELEPGVEGLVHISNLGAGRRINHPSEVLSEGDQVEVKILSVDAEARRIGLELVSHGTEESAEPAVELREGEVVGGTVESVKEYGVFVSLPGGKTGLLHVSQIQEGRTGDLKKRFNVGDAVKVEILKIDTAAGRISLSTRSLQDRHEVSQFKEFVAGKESGASFGTLGDLLKDKFKK
ncbi:MAG: 30S ribosomal protein S1 [Desulfomonile tiedjei]|nr:30S ribosomal protein S1 [Desulfomonile tiedjei]